MWKIKKNKKVETPTLDYLARLGDKKREKDLQVDKAFKECFDPGSMRKDLEIFRELQSINNYITAGYVDAGQADVSTILKFPDRVVLTSRSGIPIKELSNENLCWDFLGERGVFTKEYFHEKFYNEYRRELILCLDWVISELTKLKKTGITIIELKPSSVKIIIGNKEKKFVPDVVCLITNILESLPFQKLMKDKADNIGEIDTFIDKVKELRFSNVLQQVYTKIKCDENLINIFSNLKSKEENYFLEKVFRDHLVLQSKEDTVGITCHPSGSTVTRYGLYTENSIHDFFESKYTENFWDSCIDDLILKLDYSLKKQEYMFLSISEKIILDFVNEGIYQFDVFYDEKFKLRIFCNDNDVKVSPNLIFFNKIFSLDTREVIDLRTLLQEIVSRKGDLENYLKDNIEIDYLDKVHYFLEQSKYDLDGKEKITYDDNLKVFVVSTEDNRRCFGEDTFSIRPFKPFNFVDYYPHEEVSLVGWLKGLCSKLGLTCGLSSSEKENIINELKGMDREDYCHIIKKSDGFYAYNIKFEDDSFFDNNREHEDAFIDKKNIDLNLDFLLCTGEKFWSVRYITKLLEILD